jgi:protein SCO1/2
MLLLLVSCAGCSKFLPTKHYTMTGKVISVDANKPEVIVDSNAIPGYMDAMAMSYPVKNVSALKGVTSGDEISADLLVQGNSYWLENIRVTKKNPGPPPQVSQFRIPQPGEAVPDFSLINQNGRRIDLKQYRGKVVLLTFIYTRCPFSDYCPRISGLFADLNRKLLAESDLADRTHLLSVSFDPAHDTPPVLRKYGVTYVGDGSGFAHWEFAVPPKKSDLPDMAKFFGLTYEPDSGLITHNLSTTVIAPDGRIFRWYHGSDWNPDDLIRDVKAALQSPS